MKTSNFNLSKIIKKHVLISFTVTIIFNFTLLEFLFSQTHVNINCGANFTSYTSNYDCRHGLPYPNCNLENREEKCVKLKIHYINNTTGLSTCPADNYFGLLLDNINRAYKSSKIRFTFGSECIQRISQTNIINNSNGSALGVRVLLTDDQGVLLPEDTDNHWVPGERHPDLEYEVGYINLYIVQDWSGSSSGWEPSSLVVIELDAQIDTYVHEIGHVLGLAHTAAHGPSPLHNLTCLCKDSDIFNDFDQQKLCETTQDCLCDTGLDPASMNLNGQNMVPDGNIWVNLATCTQKPGLQSFQDGCGDKDYPWSIPYTNYMSNYSGIPGSCRHEFSPCQKALMHDIIDVIHPGLLTTCSEDVNLMCDDITIDGSMTWYGTHYMCRGQKIIITKNGSLTLDHAMITHAISSPSAPSTSCPDLKPINVWGGIIILGQDVTVGTNGPETTGNLIVKNNSVIEFAEVAISASSNFGNISIQENSIIRNCVQIMDVHDAWPEMDEHLEYQGSRSHSDALCIYAINNPPPTIKIIDSTISTDYIGFPVDYLPNYYSQIKTAGCNILINHSIIKNNYTNFNFNAIKSGKGNLTIANGSSIQNYDLGLMKTGDFLTDCSRHGFFVTNSSFINCAKAIDNTSSNFYLVHNFIVGSVTSSGISYNEIVANNFKTGLFLNKPEETSIINENLFDQAYANLQGNNLATDVFCNTWQSEPDAVEIYTGFKYLTPMSWGWDGHPAGNIHSSSPSTPTMSYTGTHYDDNGGMDHTKLKHYYLKNQTNQVFTYQNNIEGIELTTVTGEACALNLYPLTPPIGNSQESSPNFRSDSIQYDQLYTNFLSMISSLANLTGIPYTHKLEEINQNKIFRGEIVGRVSKNVQLSDSIQFDKWVGRINPEMTLFSKLDFLWSTQQFDSLEFYLNSINNDSDVAIFSLAIDYVHNSLDSNITIYNLKENDLDTLIYLASSSFDNYTNILRSFLNINYSKYIPWPLTEIEERSYTSHTSPINNITNNFKIYPNPTSSCFMLMDESGNIDDVEIKTYNAVGKLVHSGEYNTQNQICIPDLMEGIYFVNIISKTNGKTVTCKLNIIK